MIKLDKFIEMTKEKNIAMDAVMVMQDDVTLALHRFTDDIYHNVYSVSKSFTVTAVGMAIEEGLLKLTDKPIDFFRDLAPEDTDPGWEKITLYHLITMTTGHVIPHMMKADREWLRGEKEDKPDPEMMAEWLRFAFTRPVVDEPGTKFSYGNLAPYVTGRMIEKATGKTVLDYLDEKLFQPLHIKKPRWDPDIAGHTFPASYLFLDIADMIKLGQIYLHKGEFEGHRYLSEEWVEMATKQHFESSQISPSKTASDECCGYGFYFWKNTVPNSFRAYGREGQFIIVIPEKNAIIATQAMHHEVQDVLDCVWETIYPQIK